MNKQRINVLYVDDEAGNLTAFRATFRREFQVHTATSAEEGLALLEQHPVHVVISDQRMPGTTGSQFLAQVRDKYPRTIRMLLTGYSDMEAVVDAINKGGIYSYCTKPWDPNDLKLRIEQAFEVHHLREQREGARRQGIDDGTCDEAWRFTTRRKVGQQFVDRQAFGRGTRPQGASDAGVDGGAELGANLVGVLAGVGGALQGLDDDVAGGDLAGEEP